MSWSRAGSQFCEMQSEMYPTCSDYDCYNIINNIRIDNRLSYCLGNIWNILLSQKIINLPNILLKMLWRNARFLIYKNVDVSTVTKR
jgi:hypothetical protein